MISRGHYIGEIVDEFSSISAQVKLRNKLALTDLTVHAENFFRDVLNAILKSNFRNLNSERSNEPGLDLGDDLKRMAVQVTSTATAAKANKTLEKVTDEQAKQFDKIVVLIIGKRQGSYKLDDTLAAKYKFTEDNIWDLDTLARKAIDLEIQDLQSLHRIVRQNVVRLKVDLEIPDEDGNYPTSGFEMWERRVSPKVGSGAQFLEFYESEYEKMKDSEAEKVRAAIKELARTLSTMPRITREFFAMLYERRESGRSRRRIHHVGEHLILSKVEREYLGSDLRGELDILEHADLVWVEGEDRHEYGPPELFIRVSKNEDLTSVFVEFMKKKNLSYRQVLGAVDLSQF
jgi:SMEK domain